MFFQLIPSVKPYHLGVSLLSRLSETGVELG